MMGVDVATPGTSAAAAYADHWGTFQARLADVEGILVSYVRVRRDRGASWGEVGWVDVGRIRQSPLTVCGWELIC